MIRSHRNIKPGRTTEPRRPRRKGAALVEFAVVAPFLMLMLVGMIEFGRGLVLRQALTAAAREGAREASLPAATMTDVETIATEMASSATNRDVTVEVVPNLDTDDVEAGDSITVSVSAPLRSVSQMGSFWFGNDFSITATATIRKEGYE